MLARLSAIAWCLSLLFLDGQQNVALALDNGLGKTPALGWSTWNYFEDAINETLIMQMADSMVRTGLKDAGFHFINLDAGAWSPNRTSDGNIQEDRSKFPSGMKKLADYVHSKGLQLGLYTDLSNRTVGKVCGTGPGSFGHYEADMQTFANFDFDYLKVDYCAYDQTDPKRYIPSIEGQAQYWQEIRDAINKTGRPVYLYSCPRSWRDASKKQRKDGPPNEWSAQTRASLANALLTEYANSHDEWSSALSNLDAVTTTTNLSYAGPGFWQDADLLHTCEFGNGRVSGKGMTMDEYTANFVVWAVLASQMILSADLRTIDAPGRGPEYAACLKLLKSPEVLAVNQDPLGAPPRLVFSHTSTSNSTSTSTSTSASDNDSDSDSASASAADTITAQGFARKLQDGSTAAVLLNRGEATATLSISWAQLGLGLEPATSTTSSTKCSVRDLVAQKDLGEMDTGFSASLAKHSARMIRVTCG